MKRRTFLRTSIAATAALNIPCRRSLATVYQDAPQAPPDVDAITGAGKEITLRGKDIADLGAQLHGRLLLAGDQGYEQARHIINPSFDKHPALIAQVTGTGDIRSAVDFAREHDQLLLAVKCGGHSFSGKSTCDGGLMIDLSPFRNVRVDPMARRAWVTGGSLLGLLDHESMAYGLVTTMGTVSHTGVGGLVTGGGFGRVARRFGLAIDNLISVDVVTADGQLRHASAEENPDLFWGVRGGGGNFGIVTNFEFQLHPMGRRVIGGAILFPIARAREVLSLYAEYSPRAPDELDMIFFIKQAPGGEAGVVGIAVCYSGPENEAERILAPIRRLKSPLFDGLGAVDYVVLQRSGDTDDPRARASYLKSGFVHDLSADLVSAVIEGFEGDPARSTVIFYQQIGGAVSRVANDATAFMHRDAAGDLAAGIGWKHGDDPTEHISWLRRYWARIEPLTKGFYTNEIGGDITDAKVHANYRENYPRLVRIKNKYDSGNLFRLNANVQPTA